MHWHFDDEAPAQKFDIDQALAQPESGVHLYVCGPKGFMDAVLRSARAQGWEEAQLRTMSMNVPRKPTRATVALMCMKCLRRCSSGEMARKPQTPSTKPIPAGISAEGKALPVLRKP